MANKQESKRRSLTDRIENAIADADNSVVAGITPELSPNPNRVGEPSQSNPSTAAPLSQSATATPTLNTPPSVPVGAPASTPATPTTPTEDEIPAKAIISYVTYEIDTQLAILSSKERISKKRIVLEAILDYLCKKGIMSDDERQHWLLLPKDFGTKKK